jgi:hypothetical protein
LLHDFFGVIMVSWSFAIAAAQLEAICQTSFGPKILQDFSGDMLCVDPLVVCDSVS